MPKFSIIIPCYCDGILAIEAIRSCLQQETISAEIIFVDDGSPDNSYDLVNDEFFQIENVRCYRTENCGVSHARNFGLSKSTGDWVLFLDADDLLAENYLKDAAHTLAALGEDRQSVLVMPFCYFDMPGSARAKWVANYRPPMLGKSKFLNLFKLSITNCFPISSAIVSRSFEKDEKLFKESLSHYEDWELWLNLAKRGAQFHYSAPDAKNATLIRIREGVSSNTAQMLDARKLISRDYFGGTVMALWQVPIFGDRFRKAFVGFWKIVFFGSSSHPNLTAISNYSSK